MQRARLAGFLFSLLIGASVVGATTNQLPISALPMIAKVKIPIGPGWLGVGFGSVWVAKSQSAALLRIDPATNTVVATIPVGPDSELGVGIGLGSVWLTDTKDRSLRQIDPATNKVVRTFKVNISAEPEGSIGVGAGSIWLLTNENETDSGTLSRVDPTSGKVIANIKVKPKSYAALVSDQSVWVTNSADSSVMRVDAITNKVVADIRVHASPRFIAAGEGGIWVLNQGDGTLSRIDPATNHVVATIELGVPGPGGDIWIEDGYVWVSAEGVPLSMVDPRTNTLVKQFAGGQKDDTLRVGFGAAWVLEELSGDIWKVSVDKLRKSL
jgi:YVTN family beta-propeller protein